MRGSILVATAALSLVGVSPAVTGQSVADVGDADSFGRSVTYMGMVQTAQVLLQPDCSQIEPPVRCVTVSEPAATVSFNEPNLGTIRLPARSTRSLLCFSMTASSNYRLINTRPGYIYGSFAGWAVVEVENSILNAPGLVDPQTGTPLNGRITYRFSTTSEDHVLQPGQTKMWNGWQSRECLGGLSRRALMDTYGLSSWQASEFFRRPITLRFGSAGSGFGVEYASYFYGMRMYGD